MMRETSTAAETTASGNNQSSAPVAASLSMGAGIEPRLPGSLLGIELVVTALQTIVDQVLLTHGHGLGSASHLPADSEKKVTPPARHW